MNRNFQIAAAVAAVLAAAGANATAPTPSSAAAPNVSLYIAGSSAAQAAVLGALENHLCGGSYSLFSSTGNTNFFAVSCTPASGVVTGATGSAVFTIWYRAEGGSVVGALPLVSGSLINQMSLGAAALVSTSGTVSTYTVPVSGSSASNGVDDSFGTNVFKAPVQFGITDVEPKALTGDNYPSAYLTSVYGKATANQLGALTKATLFDQVFGIFVNNSTGSNLPASLNLGKDTITNILQGNTTDWSLASDTTGAAVTSTSTPIIIVNREQGSGSRTATSIFFTGDECVPGATSILESTGGTADSFSTGNVLAAANTNPGSITYASIDNAGSTKYPNLTLVSVDGVVPSQLAAAAGEYGDWFEATGVTGTAPLGAEQTAVIAYLKTQFQTQATAPNAKDVLAIPNSFNTASLPVSGTLANSIYVNPFTRSGVSCNTPLNTI